MRMRFAIPSAIAFAGALMLAACGQPAPLYVDQAWISAAASPDKPSAGYFVIHGGEEPVQLQAVETEVAQRVEMHGSVMQNGMMTMTPIKTVDVPAKGKVAFAPGGKHLMLFGLNPGAVKMGKASLTLIFSNGDRIIIDAKIQKQGEAAPAAANDDDKGEHAEH